MPTKKKPTKKAKTPLTEVKLPRPAIVTVMGHVDHGKTTLLSAIRERDLTSQEHGGITQHIGAYQVTHKKQKITFIDTPGHAAFVKMRSRGALVTDLVVLVIAADDGVKPQTKESLVHIKKAKVPFLVAINKIDLAAASVEKVKSQLAENKVLVEGYGGKIVCVEVSAKQKKGLTELLEMILLLAQMQDFKASPKAKLEAVVIETKLDAQKGPLATVLIKNGTLKLKDQVFSNGIKCKVKSMLDENDQRVNQAGPGKPVVVMGFEKLPGIGAPVGVKPGKRVALKKPEKPIKKDEEETEEKKRIKLILKADTHGSLEAIEANLPSEVEIILGGVGQPTESDVLLAQSSQAVLIAFNLKVPASVKRLAELEKVKIKSYNIIYKLLEELEEKVLKILEPTIDEELLGEAEIIAEFKIKGSHVAGCKIKKGKISKKDKLHLKRKGKILGDASIKSFQKEKQEVEEAKAGTEVGLVLSPDLDFKIGDAIIAYSKQK